jgi:hypothetical protein
MNEVVKAWTSLAILLYSFLLPPSLWWYHLPALLLNVIIPVSCGLTMAIFAVRPRNTRIYAAILVFLYCLLLGGFLLDAWYRHWCYVIS